MVEHKSEQVRITRNGVSVGGGDPIEWSAVLGGALVNDALVIFHDGKPPWVLTHGSPYVDDARASPEEGANIIEKRLADAPDLPYRGESKGRKRSKLSARQLANRVADGREVEGAVTFELRRTIGTDAAILVLGALLHACSWVFAAVVAGTLFVTLVGDHLFSRRGAVWVVLGFVGVAVVGALIQTLSKLPALLRTPRAWRCLLAPEGMSAEGYGWLWSDIERARFTRGALTVRAKQGNTVHYGIADVPPGVLNALITAYRERRET